MPSVYGVRKEVTRQHSKRQNSKLVASTNKLQTRALRRLGGLNTPYAHTTQKWQIGKENGETKTIVQKVIY